VSLDSIRVDGAGAYQLGDVGVTDYPRTAGEWCLPANEAEPIDLLALSGQLYDCVDAEHGLQTFTVPDGVNSLNVWLSGGGGGFGSQAHPPMMGAAAGLTYGTLAVSPGDELVIMVGCPGADGCNANDCGKREGGAGGGASAVLSGGTALLVAGGAGGQAGAAADGSASTHGGHGGGVSGETGGTTQCNDNVPGGNGGTQSGPGAGGASNRGYQPGDAGHGHDGGHGGGTDDALATAGGGGFGGGGAGRHVGGDGGGGGGGGGWFG
jgi:hypothetical protein